MNDIFPGGGFFLVGGSIYNKTEEKLAKGVLGLLVVFLV